MISVVAVFAVQCLGFIQCLEIIRVIIAIEHCEDLLEHFLFSIEELKGECNYLARLGFACVAVNSHVWEAICFANVFKVIWLGLAAFADNENAIVGRSIWLFSC